ncbi:unnamed protein product [Ranitomeya imitator]|uniref:Uncharacterized protein n=1 Tax=Ranitomeya imitator TaxID=111125 RepID=A0ABN9LTL3_9NEOB|nr:unnamed protein product [Ranitomeya imitator]
MFWRKCSKSLMLQVSPKGLLGFTRTEQWMGAEVGNACALLLLLLLDLFLMRRYERLKDREVSRRLRSIIKQIDVIICGGLPFPLGNFSEARETSLLTKNPTIKVPRCSICNKKLSSLWEKKLCQECTGPSPPKKRKIQIEDSDSDFEGPCDSVSKKWEEASKAEKYLFYAEYMEEVFGAVRRSMGLEEEQVPQTIQDEMFGGLKAGKQIGFTVHENILKMISQEWESPEKRLSTPSELKHWFPLEVESVSWYILKVDVQDDEHIVLEPGDLFPPFSPPPSPQAEGKKAPQYPQQHHLFRVLKTPVMDNVRSWLDQVLSRPVTALDNERFTVQSVILIRAVPVIMAAFLITNALRFIFHAPGTPPASYAFLQLQEVPSEPLQDVSDSLFVEGRLPGCGDFDQAGYVHISVARRCVGDATRDSPKTRAKTLRFATRASFFDKNRTHEKCNLLHFRASDASVNAVLPVLPLLFPVMWILVTALCEARVLAQMSRKYPTSLVAKFSEDTLSSYTEVASTQEMLRSVCSHFLHVVRGTCETLAYTSRLLHGLGSVTVICCVDKQGVLSWPNPSPETVLFFSGRVDQTTDRHDDLTDQLSLRSYCQTDLEDEPQEMVALLAETNILQLVNEQDTTERQNDVARPSETQRKPHSRNKHASGSNVSFSQDTGGQGTVYCTLHGKQLRNRSGKTAAVPRSKGTVTLSDAAAIPTTMSIAAASLFGRWRAVTQTALQLPTILKSPVTRVNISVNFLMAAADTPWFPVSPNEGFEKQILRKKVLDFYQRACLSGYCSAFSYKPMHFSLSPQLHGKCIEMQHGLGHSAVSAPGDVGGFAPMKHTGRHDSWSSDEGIGEVTEDFTQAMSGQIFMGMVSSQYQARLDIVRLIDGLVNACIRFVYFSMEDELRSKVFAEKMGLETGWNCHISLTPNGDGPGSEVPPSSPSHAGSLRDDFHQG